MMTKKKTAARFLQFGDVFALERGMKVYASIPERFIFINASAADETVSHEVVVGTAIPLQAKRAEYRVSKDCGCRVCPKHAEFPFNERDVLDTDYLIGNYRVIGARYEGGGVGMGPNDVYPDGWHVTAVSVADDNVMVAFYQSGAFTAVIPPHAITIADSPRR